MRISVYCVWLIGLVWAGNAALAADGHGIPAEESARHTTFASDSALIPLQKAGNLLLLECTVEGETGLFILDSGASNLVLNETYFRGLRGTEEVATAGIDGNGSARRVVVDKLQCGDFSCANLRADVTDLGAIEAKRGVKIYGLFGLDLLRDCNTTLDVRNRLLILHPKEKNSLQPRKADLTCAIELTTEALFVDVGIAGIEMTWAFDTGAELNVIDTRVPAEVLATVRIRKRSVMTGSSGRDVEVLVGSLERLDLCEKHFDAVPVLVTKLDRLGEVYRRKISGIIGVALLERGVVEINLQTNTFSMYLYD